jgi:hypothetical protein
MVTAKTAWSSAALEFSGRLRVPPWRIIEPFRTNLSAPRLMNMR